MVIHTPNETNRECAAYADVMYKVVYVATQSTQSVIVSCLVLNASGHHCLFSGIGGLVSGIADVVGRDCDFHILDSCREATSGSKMREPSMRELCAPVEDTSWWAPVLHFRPDGLFVSPHACHLQGRVINLELGTLAARAGPTCCC